MRYFGISKQRRFLSGCSFSLICLGILLMSKRCESPNSAENFQDIENSSTVHMVPLQLIAAWTNNTASQFFPQLFHSARQNQGVLNLLLVDRDIGHGCIDKLDSYSEGNVKTLCISEPQFYELHTKYLCSVWACTEQERSQVFDHLEKRKAFRNNEYKPLYGQIFQEFLDPHQYAAWSDVDQMLGDFSKLPAYALDGSFDLFTMTAGGEDVNNLYLRGQFTAVKRSPRNDNLWAEFPELSSPESFISSFPRGSLDERYYSMRYMSHSEVNWLQLSHGLGGDHNIRELKVKSVQKALDIINVPLFSTNSETLLKLQAIDEHHFPIVFQPELNDIVKVTTDCPKHWLQDETTRCVTSNDTETVLYTAKMHGIVTQAKAKDLNSVPRRKFLNHFHTIKRRAWFDVPQPLKNGQIFDFSFYHVSLWTANNLQYLKCYAGGSEDKFCAL